VGNPADRAADGAAEPPARAVAPAAAVARDPWFRGKWWFLLPWPLLVALDLWSKAVVFEALAQAHPLRPNNPLLSENHRVPIEVFDGIVRFELVSWGNTGTIWGAFQGATLALMVLRCAAVVGLVWFLRLTPRAARLQQFVLSLILAGALGNLYDNFTRVGVPGVVDESSVRDFLHFSGTWPVKWDFPAFNVADSCITVGAIGLFMLLWREDRKGRQKRVS
jgi:signal peptidase II